MIVKKRGGCSRSLWEWVLSGHILGLRCGDEAAQSSPRAFLLQLPIYLAMFRISVTPRLAHCLQSLAASNNLRLQGTSRAARYFFSAKLIQYTTSARYHTNISYKSASNNYKMAAGQDILSGKYPAKQHAKRVVEYLKSKHPDATGLLYLESQKTTMIEDNDEAAPFRSARFLAHSSAYARRDS